MAKVAVVIPNYNGIKYIENCLESLKKQSFRDFEIIIIDNASADGSAELIEEKYSEIYLKKLSSNFGFSRAVNEGIKLSRAEYVILLNNDTVCDEHFVEELYLAISKDDGIFSVSSKMIQLNNKELIDDAGDLYCALGWAFGLGKDKSKELYNDEYEIFSACAGAAIYNKKLFDRVGYFDEWHFSYLEDVDIGYRAKILGYKNMYSPKAIVYHAGSGSSGSRHNPFKIRLTVRNTWYVIYKNMPILQIIINLPFIILGFMIKALFFSLKGHFRPYFSGMKRGFLLCLSTKRFPHSYRYFGNYLKIQLELWVNTVRRISG